MGRALREKIDNDPKGFMDRNSLCKSIIESGLRHLSHQLGSRELAQDTNPNPNFDDSGWGYCTEEQLEEMLLRSLQSSYNETIKKLVSMGYDEDVVLKAILRNGHCYGAKDARNNIMHNTLTYLTSGGSSESNSKSEDSDAEFVDLKQLETCSLGAMVYLLQQLKPNLSKGDAMWCLLMSDLHVGRASGIELPSIPSPKSGCGSSNSSPGNSNMESGIVQPPLCKFHCGWGFNLQREIVCPKRFNLTPSMKALLKRNVAMFAAGFRANSKDESSSNMEKNEEPKSFKNQEMVNMMLSKFRDLNLDGKIDYLPEDQKEEMILGLYHQIKDLEAQVKERKEWAHQKALQAARKLSQDLTELKILRMERDEIQRPKKVDTDPNDPTMHRLKEMENSVGMANVQVERAMTVKKELENENREIRAEMEAFKLSASESMKTCLEIAKREKKHLKRLLAWEKQKAKLQEDIKEEKQRILELKEEAAQVAADRKVAEAKWRQAQKAKELAQVQVDEERRLKEAEEANTKRKMESLRLKIEIDFRRHKDDLQRLEQELSRLKESTESWTPQGGTHQGEKIKGLTIQELGELDDDDNGDSFKKEASYNRVCLICKKEEVSVVFLPCAHQVVCGNCDEGYGKKGRAICPCCRVPIEQRIRVFGASS